MHGEPKMNTVSLLESLKGWGHMEDKGVNGDDIKMDFKVIGRKIMD